MNIPPQTLISDHHFNLGIDLVVPGTREVPSSITSELKEHHAYRIRDLAVCDLLEEDFIEAFVKRGPMYMMSYNTILDSDDCVALIPPGTLLLMVTKDTYQELGLLGKHSEACSKGKPDRYVVSIPLTAQSFRPGKKQYDRTLEALSQRVRLKFDFLATWCPADSKVCSSSIKHYFYKILDYIVDEVDLTSTVRQLRDFKMPHPPLQPGNDTALDSLSADEFLEWLGGVICDIEFAKGAGEFVSSLLLPESQVVTKSCVLCQYRGFITPQAIATIGKALREYLDKAPASSAPWVAMTVHGFHDAPVTWNTKENSSKTGGEHFYTLVFRRGKGCSYYTGNGVSVQCNNLSS